MCKSYFSKPTATSNNNRTWVTNISMNFKVKFEYID